MYLAEFFSSSVVHEKRKKTSNLVIFSILEFLCTTVEAGSLYFDSIGFADVDKTLGGPTPVTKILDTGFSIYRQSVTWQSAKEICERNKQKLGFFLNNKDYDNVAEHIYRISDKSNKTDQSEFRLNRRYWIGLTDKEKHGIWQWTGLNSKTLGKNSKIEKINKWTTGSQPEINNNSTAEHCTIIWNPLRKLHMWKADKCTNKYYFICKDTEKKTDSKENFVK